MALAGVVSYTLTELFIAQKLVSGLLVPFSVGALLGGVIATLLAVLIKDEKHTLRRVIGSGLMLILIPVGTFFYPSVFSLEDFVLGVVGFGCIMLLGISIKRSYILILFSFSVSIFIIFSTPHTFGFDEVRQSRKNHEFIQEFQTKETELETKIEYELMSLAEFNWIEYSAGVTGYNVFKNEFYIEEKKVFEINLEDEGIDYLCQEYRTGTVPVDSIVFNKRLQYLQAVLDTVKKM